MVQQYAAIGIGSTVYIEGTVNRIEFTRNDLGQDTSCYDVEITTQTSPLRIYTIKNVEMSSIKDVDTILSLFPTDMLMEELRRRKN